MDGFGLLLGHLVGDYLVQNDWMAKWKANPEPSPEDLEFLQYYNPGPAAERLADERCYARARANAACTAHCLCYTLAVWAFSFAWMPWWGLVLCFAAHWPIDRFRLARWWMEHVSGQKAFASGPLAPWSIVMVDNVFHLLTLFAIWQLWRFAA